MTDQTEDEYEIFKTKGPLPFFLSDFERDTMGWTSMQRWRYLRLLCYLWANGGIVPMDKQLLADIFEVERVDIRGTKWLKSHFFRTFSAVENEGNTVFDASKYAELSPKWFFKIMRKLIPHPTEPGHLAQKRILRDLDKLKALSQKRAVAGRAGGRKTQAARSGKKQASASGQNKQKQKQPNKQVLEPESSLSTPTLDRESPNISDTLEQGAKKPGPNADAERLNVDEFANELFDIIGVDPNKDPSFTQINELRLWLSDGADPELDIKGAVQDVMARRKAGGITTAPNSLRYFSNAVAEARERRISGKSGKGSATAGQPAGGGLHPDADKSLEIARLTAWVDREQWLASWGEPPPMDKAQKRLVALTGGLNAHSGRDDG